MFCSNLWMLTADDCWRYAGVHYQDKCCPVQSALCHSPHTANSTFISVLGLTRLHLEDGVESQSDKKPPPHAQCSTSWRGNQRRGQRLLKLLRPKSTVCPGHRAVPQAGLLPGVWELQVGHIEDPFPVRTVVVIHKFLELHLAVFLFGDIGDINTPLWS